jgi:hypothetical protein
MTTRKTGRQSPDEAAHGDSARYGEPAGPRGSGHHDSRKAERKEQGWVSRQGGAQSEHGQASGEPKPDGPKGKGVRR